MLPLYYLFLILLPETDRHTKFADEQPSIKKNISCLWSLHNANTFPENPMIHHAKQENDMALVRSTVSAKKKVHPFLDDLEQLSWIGGTPSTSICCGFFSLGINWLKLN